MNRRFLLEASTLVGAALLCALVANTLAGRERKMALAGSYPNALRVPHEGVSAPLTETATTTATATNTPPPASGAPATTTIAPLTPTSTAPSGATSAASPGHAAAVPDQGSSAANPAAPTASKPATPAASSASSPSSPAPLPASQFAPHPDKPYVEIGYAAVASLHGAHALFLDARRTSVFEQGHIAGARPFSVWESDIDEKVNKLFEERSDPRAQAEPIVVYCSGGECEDSHMLAQKLWGIQFNNVYVYKDGFPDWQRRRGAVRTGAMH